MANFRVFTPGEKELFFHGASSFEVCDGGALHVVDESGPEQWFSPIGWLTVVDKDTE